MGEVSRLGEASKGIAVRLHEGESVAETVAGGVGVEEEERDEQLGEI